MSINSWFIAILWCFKYQLETTRALYLYFCGGKREECGGGEVERDNHGRTLNHYESPHHEYNMAIYDYIHSGFYVHMIMVNQKDT